jgi:hypothetical protein
MDAISVYLHETKVLYTTKDEAPYKGDVNFVDRIQVSADHLLDNTLRFGVVSGDFRQRIFHNGGYTILIDGFE